jgi:molybdopterin synthase sulfur carrier subunit
MPRVFIPPTLRTLTGGRDVVAVEGRTIRAAVEHLEALHPGIQSHLLDGQRLRSGMTIAVNNRFVPDGLRTAVNADDEIHFLPTIGGG